MTIPGGRRPLQQRGGTEEVYDILHEGWFDEIEDKDFQEEREAIRLWLHVSFLLDFVFGRKI